MEYQQELNLVWKHNTSLQKKEEASKTLEKAFFSSTSQKQKKKEK